MRFKEVQIKPGKSMEDIAVPGTILKDSEGSSELVLDVKGKKLDTLRREDIEGRSFLILYKNAVYSGKKGKFLSAKSSQLIHSRNPGPLYKINNEEGKALKWAREAGL